MLSASRRATTSSSASRAVERRSRARPTYSIWEVQLPSLRPNAARPGLAFGAALARNARARAPVRAFVDTNVFVRHLTGDPPEQAAAATAFLSDAEELYVP